MSYLAIRFARHGCTNRPFYHIVVSGKTRSQYAKPLEQLGSFDPMPNKYNESLISVNFDRVKYYMGKGATPTKGVEHLLGLSGFLPLHPMTVINAERKRKRLALEAAKETEAETDSDILEAEASQ